MFSAGQIRDRARLLAHEVKLAERVAQARPDLALPNAVLLTDPGFLTVDQLFVAPAVMAVMTDGFTVPGEPLPPFNLPRVPLFSDHSPMEAPSALRNEVLDETPLDQLMSLPTADDISPVADPSLVDTSLPWGDAESSEVMSTAPSWWPSWLGGPKRSTSHTDPVLTQTEAPQPAIVSVPAPAAVSIDPKLQANIELLQRARSGDAEAYAAFTALGKGDKMSALYNITTVVNGSPCVEITDTVTLRLVLSAWELPKYVVVQNGARTILRILLSTGGTHDRMYQNGEKLVAAGKVRDSTVAQLNGNSNGFPTHRDGISGSVNRGRYPIADKSGLDAAVAGLQVLGLEVEVGAEGRD